MYVVRRFCVRHAQVFEWLYQRLEGFFMRLAPLYEKIGYERLEAPVVLVERVSKGFLFDCQMCGQCVLSSTGMSCPMNCPKNIRNGPCGGVREGGFCEVKPEMRCVWVEGWNGAARMKNGLERIRVVQPPVNRELSGSSSWLRVIRERSRQAKQVRSADDPSKTAVARAFEDARKIEPGVAPLASEPEAALSDQSVDERTSVYRKTKAKG